MSAARDLLRAFWAEGVRVHALADRFRLDPRDAADPFLHHSLRQLHAEVREILTALPAPDRCRVCGQPTNSPTWANAGEIQCVACCLIAADRMKLRRRARREEMTRAA